MSAAISRGAACPIDGHEHLTAIAVSSVAEVRQRSRASTNAQPVQRRTSGYMTARAGWGCCFVAPGGIGRSGRFDRSRMNEADCAADSRHPWLALTLVMAMNSLWPTTSAYWWLALEAPGVNEPRSRIEAGGPSGAHHGEGIHSGTTNEGVNEVGSALRHRGFGCPCSWGCSRVVSRSRPSLKWPRAETSPAPAIPTAPCRAGRHHGALFRIQQWRPVR